MIQLLSFYRSIVLSFYRSIVLSFYRSIVLSFYRSIVLSFYRSRCYLLPSQLNNLFKSSDMRFGGESPLTFNCKHNLQSSDICARNRGEKTPLGCELILNRLFNWEDLYNSHSSDKYAGNRGEKTPSGCELILNRLFNREDLYNSHSSDKYAGNRGEKTPSGCELTLSQTFKHGSSHTLQSRNIESSDSRRYKPLFEGAVVASRY